MSAHHRMAVDPLQCEYDDSWEKPLPERGIVVMDAMKDEEEVHQGSSSPVDHIERDEPELLAEGCDAWDGHGYYGNQNNHSSDRGEEVGVQAGIEVGGGWGGGVSVVEGKGGKVCEEVDSGPHEDTHGYDDVESQCMWQWEDLKETCGVQM